MNKGFLIYKLADRVKAASRIDSDLFPKYGVKRGLRNEDGSGVLVGLTNVGNVVGYQREADGRLTPVEGKLFYRGYELSELVAPLRKENRLGFEEVAYLLLSGDLPDREELDSFRELLNSKMPLDHRSMVHIIDLEGVPGQPDAPVHRPDREVPDHHRLCLQLLPAFRAGAGTPYPPSPGKPFPGRELPLPAEGRFHAAGGPDAGPADDYAGGARRR